MSNFHVSTDKMQVLTLKLFNTKELPKQAIMQVVGLVNKKPLLGFAFKLTATISLQLLGVGGDASFKVMACSSSAGMAGCYTQKSWFLHWIASVL